MDYSPWFKGKILLFWRQTKKGQNPWNQRPCTQNWFPCISHQLYLHEFFESIFDPHEWPKGEFGCFEGKQEGAKSPKPKKPCPPKLVSMHFTSIATCMNFWANSNFWPPWTIVHGTTLRKKSTIVSSSWISLHLYLRSNSDRHYSELGISIVNPMPLFQSLFLQSYPLIFFQTFLGLYNMVHLWQDCYRWWERKPDAL